MRYSYFSVTSHEADARVAYSSSRVFSRWPCRWPEAASSRHSRHTVERFLPLERLFPNEPLLVDLLRRMLAIDPAARITAADALRHEFFTASPITITRCEATHVAPPVEQREVLTSSSLSLSSSLPSSSSTVEVAASVPHRDDESRSRREHRNHDHHHDRHRHKERHDGERRSSMHYHSDG